MITIGDRTRDAPTTSGRHPCRPPMAFERSGRMARHRLRGMVLVSCAVPYWAAGAPRRGLGQGPAADAGAADLKERDRLWGEAQKLRGEGKTAEAIAAAEAMLAIERKLLPADHPDLAVSLG